MNDIDAHLHDWPAWPVYGLIDDLLPVLERWHQDDETVAIATLVDIVGSSPRPLGSEMAVTASGRVAGYVSGGCVEGAVAAQALAVLASGRPRLLDYGAGSPVLDVQLTCGGRIGILVRAIPDLAVHLQRRRAARNNRQALLLDIDMASGAEQPVPDRNAPASFAAGFRQSYLPPARLMAIGGDPVTLAVCELAPLFGFEVGLIRPYGPSAAPPGSQLAYYDTRPLLRALPDLPLDAWSALYTLTHDIDDDHAALAHGLSSPAFRVGALGSQSKTTQRLAYLRAAGFDEQALARLDTPAGLDIGARNPREIALSVIAGATAARPASPRACQLAGAQILPPAD